MRERNRGQARFLWWDVHIDGVMRLSPHYALARTAQFPQHPLAPHSAWQPPRRRLLHRNSGLSSIIRSGGDISGGGWEGAGDTGGVEGASLRSNQADNLPAPLAIDGKVTI